ncbi:MAG: LysR substrate-binding domain-containing protein [Pseudomonadota bacterium]
MISLRQVEAFRAVMITGTVTQAASLLFVSQPAISRMIADLEAEIGFKLFERTNRQLVPTAEGHAFYEEVDRAFVGLDQITKTAQAIKEYRTGNFHLITIPSLASSLIPEVIRKFSETYPDVSISLEVQPSQRVFEWIVSQQCDIGLSTLPVENAAIETRAIAQGEAVCVLPPGHPLTQKSKITVQDLGGESFISFKADSIFRHMIDDLFKKAKVRRVLKFQARTSEAICSLVSSGLGMSIVGPVLPGVTFSQDVVVRPFRPSISIDLALMYPAHKPLSRIAQSFVELLQQHIKANNMTNS